ncbi:MAG: DUF2357 domain-containing protein [Planctomycetaceae bacterium]|nr:DUF2357 domain-containing protein [Planctomycetaceae bacterium]
MRPMLAETPWSPGNADLSGDSLSGSRLFVVVPASNASCFFGASFETVPVVARWVGADGQHWIRFELPVPNDENHDASQQRYRTSETIEIEVPGQGRFVMQLSRLFHWSSDVRNTIDRVIDNHIDTILSLYDRAARSRSETSIQIQGIALRDIDSLVEEWLESGSQTDARLALIVRLAETIPETLKDVCDHPRVSLRRERQLQPLGRIQQVDSACLRWLARQPGETVAEKAGVRQKALAVVRVDDLDSAENRVVADLLKRAKQACGRYCHEFSDHSSSLKVKKVARFGRLVDRLLKESPVSRAGRLTGHPQPNYVLMHDSRYRILWDAYLQLFRQQSLEEKVWRWQARLFSEHILFAVMAALNGLCDSCGGGSGDMAIRTEQVSGTFLDDRTMAGPWYRGTSGDQFHLILRHQLNEHSEELGKLTPLSPDFAIVSGNSTIAFWTVFDFGAAADQFEARLVDLEETLQQLPGNEIRGILVEPVVRKGGGGPSLTIESLDLAEGWQLTVPVQNHAETFRERIQWLFQQ